MQGPSGNAYLQALCVARRSALAGLLQLLEASKKSLCTHCPEGQEPARKNQDPNATSFAKTPQMPHNIWVCTLTSQILWAAPSQKNHHEVACRNRRSSAKSAIGLVTGSLKLHMPLEGPLKGTHLITLHNSWLKMVGFTLGSFAMRHVRPAHGP